MSDPPPPDRSGRENGFRRLRSGLQRGWSRIARVAVKRPVPAVPVAEPAAEQPPEAVLHLLRHLGVAMCQAGDAVDRVTMILDDVAAAYGAHGVRFIVLPTGVFVRIEAAAATRVDFAPGSNAMLRLDQIDELYRLIDDIRLRRIDVEIATSRLEALLAAAPRVGPVVRILGHGILTLGLGLVLNPALSALPAYLVLGLLVGVLRWWADRDHVVELVLPVMAAFVVSWASFELVGPLLGVPALDIVIPALVTFLPGAALTIATVELSANSMVSGSARLVFGLERLLLLSFGIVLGVQLAGIPPTPHASPMGGWAPWVGVLIFGIGQYFASSAPRRTLRWLLVVLYVAYAVQAGTAVFVGSLGASFVAGAVVLPVAYAVQHRRSGPPVPVTFLPAFWLLVPGALGLEGITEIVGAQRAGGLGDFINALLTVVAIAVGVVVGTGLSRRIGRATSTWRGI